jgi:predicted transcriptional regulator
VYHNQQMDDLHLMLWRAKGYPPPARVRSMAEEKPSDITSLTVQLLSAFVSNNSVPSESLADLIKSTRAALTEDTDKPTADGALPEHVPAVSVRKSLASADFILSLIDGKPYKTLKRHLATHGLTPAEYRERYNLPKTYPLVSKSYSEARRAVATRLGLGRKAAPASVDQVSDTSETVEIPAAKEAAPARVKKQPATSKRAPTATPSKTAPGSITANARPAPPKKREAKAKPSAATATTSSVVTEASSAAATGVDKVSAANRKKAQTAPETATNAASVAATKPPASSKLGRKRLSIPFGKAGTDQKAETPGTTKPKATPKNATARAKPASRTKSSKSALKAASSDAPEPGNGD